MNGFNLTLTFMCWGTLAFVVALFGIWAYFSFSLVRLVLKNLSPIVRAIAIVLALAFAVLAVTTEGLATPLEIIPVLLWIGSGGKKPKDEMPTIKERIG